MIEKRIEILIKFCKTGSADSQPAGSVVGGKLQKLVFRVFEKCDKNFATGSSSQVPRVLAGKKHVLR